MKRLVSLFTAILVSALLGCSSAVQIASSWNENAIVVDGSSADWGTSLKLMADPSVAVGIRNDDRFLYICLTTQNPVFQTQILQGGLTVWFDPKGEQEEVFGIRFPMPGENTPLWNPREPLAASFPFLEPSFRELSILGAEGQQELFSVLEIKGIKVKMGASESGLVYELQVPLRSSAEFRYAAGSLENQALGIGFQTQEFGPDRLQGPSGRASAGTRGGGRGRSGRAGGAPLAGTERPESLELWTKVMLSSRQ